MDKARSYEWGKAAIREWIFSNFNEDAKILDVGAGCGTYYWILHPKYKHIDAVEIYEKNITDYRLDKKYERVFNENITNFLYGDYDLIIFGDIIEHLTVEDAQRVIEYALQHSRTIVVAVPFLLKSGVNENAHEKHIQDDLTPEIISERYPMLQLLHKNNKYGYYIAKNA